MRRGEAAPSKNRTNGVRRSRPADDRARFCLVDFVAQKVHFRCGAKRVLKSSTKFLNRSRP